MKLKTISLIAAQYRQLTQQSVLSTGHVLEWHWHWTKNAGKIQANPGNFHQIQHNSTIVCTTAVKKLFSMARQIATIWGLNVWETFANESKPRFILELKATAWHCCLFFHLIALILQFTFWCKLYGKLLYYFACILVFLTTYIHNINFGACWGFSKSISKVSRIMILLKCISITIQFRSIIPNTEW